MGQPDVVHRRAARVLVLDPEGHVLLFRGGDPASPSKVWFTPGGEVEPGETAAEAAVRELLEEAGIGLANVEGPVAEGRVVFRIRDLIIDQQQTYFVAQVASRDVRLGHSDETEAETLLGHRWWSSDQLRTATEQIAPPELAQLLESLPTATGSPVRLPDDLSQAQSDRG